MIHFDRMTSDRCPSGYALDRLLAGELEPAGAAALRGHARTCAPCAERVTEMERSAARFAAMPPPLTATPGRAATPALRARWKRHAAVGGVLAAAAASLLITLQRPGPRPIVDENTRIKGGQARVVFYVARDGQVRLGGPHEVVHPGDSLQFVYTAGESGYLAILSRDGAGAGSIYFSDRDRAAAIEPGDGVRLPHSVTLDSTLGPETIYVLSCDHPAVLEPLRSALAGDGERAIDAPAGCSISTLHIDKRPP